jgi:2-polyprenyl-3-methyl-5-hydroxy-6-metoxy-1,4-benzoquinol methylase
MRSCDACGGNNIGALLEGLTHRYHYSGQTRVWQYQLLECRHCRLGFVDPVPSRELVQTLYDQAYYNAAGRVSDGSNYALKLRIAELRHASIGSRGCRAVADTCLGLLAEWFTGRTVSYSLGVPVQLPKEAQIFDLGCGRGDWLLAMSARGYCNLHGYDIESNVEGVTRLAKHGVAVTRGSFLENEYPGSSFDCIRMEHVFEHLLDPVKVLRKCHGMLRPGGFLVMNFPCRDSWSMSLSMRDNPSLDLPRHLYHHTLPSATVMVERAGFTLRKIYTYAVAKQLGGTINNMLSRQGRRTVPSCVVEFLAPVYRLLGGLSRDFVTVWAEKLP